ncbi:MULTISPECIES: TonB-dependent receptor [unclassified Sphingopyxis]|jgi:iron complex outermembrane receptor protein|uniref:TonB-dependent receptor n=1 Tax=unclassified Sphingopyxis TaxID=2614943 RepID=UPI00285674EC|nr:MULTISPECIES: TonB-dependent receptor [unclassified Sphingopyxis]MDR7058750.1 iron complex outermembrane receptor protein [Sphingopyxis sp. BE235]MDR7179064.1 iron complex outermembrane receptor protein [Sphingopyxis sp. BE249]
MGVSYKAGLKLGIAVAGLVSAAPSFAQDAPKDDSTGVEEIVVTARGRGENLQDVPVAVTAFSAQSIADRKIEGVGDFLSATPNISINQSQSAGVSFITVRGVSQVRNGESPVAVVIDGVQQVTSRQLTQELFDLERIEVLRGPQGALYGRNAIGGAIVITTKKPSETFEGSLALGYGRGEDYRARGSVSGPLAGDALRFRVAGSYRNLDGYFRNAYLGKKVDGVEDLNLRGQLFAELAPNFTADLKAQYGRTEGGGGNFQYQSANFDPARPCFLDAANPFGGPAPDANRVTRRYCATNLGYNLRKTAQVSLKLEYDAGFATITNVAAYDRVKEYIEGDQFPYTASVDVFGTDGTQTQFEDVRAWSNELRITSPSNQPFRWMVGAYYLDTKRFISTTTGDDNLQGVVDVRRNPQFANPANPTLSFLADDNRNRAWAVFGNIAYDVTDRLELSLAGRYDKDRRRQAVRPDQTGSLPVGCTVAAPDNCIKRNSYDLFQPKLSVKYQAMDNLNLFGSWGVGFRSGQFNQSGVAAAAAAAGVNGVSDVVKQEEAETFELGFKSDLFDRRLRLNGTFYTTKDENPLYFVFIGSIGAQVLVNIDRVRSTGFELEAQARLADGLDAFANYGYTHSRIKEYAVDPALTGNWTPYVPRDTWALGLQYRTAIAEDIGLFSRADVEHRGKQYWDPENSTARDGFELVNLRFGIEQPDGRWSLVGSIDNLFDKKYNAEWVLGGFVQPALSRTWSLDFSMKF